MILSPYCLNDGIPTIKDSDIMSLYDTMESEGLVDTVFYDGSVRDRETFAGVMKRNFMCVVVEEKKPIAFFWLTDRNARRAQIHFCFFKEARGKRAVEVGTFILNALSKAKLDCLIGYIPAFNQPAIQFFKRLGVQFAGTIPNGIYNHKTGKSEPCHVVYFDMVSADKGEE